VNNFNETAVKHSITIQYLNKLDNSNESKIKVCLSGENTGEYHGVLLIQEEQKGSSIIQLAVWLKAIITESNNEIPSQDQGSSNSGSSGNSNSIKEIPKDKNEVEETEKITSKVVQETNNRDKFTANVASKDIKETLKKNHYVLWTILGLLVLITIIILIIGTINMRKRRNKNVL